ncbi:hypothetical protein GCM10010112_48890 [Actinoplanes lobatus]|uniref:Galactokinase n=1 Tax=Actinoplanes lobatus TaxID=113568 RepID=A0A7W7HP13_9ACTN|nr:galactokinase [Actinoplanes lobatus]MBB4754048.1 galactokinase [Actinoplanes lobatus]GGN76592.1 hypothetical protein GCM10010112_48890 [Actinoplanes lobatus]GIE40896.1 hypothetical protein Alo02nite_37940 [Actinoplanes lobatus]
MSGASRPVRACLSGEDLDWLGGRALCVALDLRTTVSTSPPDDSGGEHTPWAGAVWDFLRPRVEHLAPAPTPVRVSSQAPIASGLSSSTALIMAIFDVYAPHAPRSDRVRWAYEFEFAFCNGGGMDQLAIDLGGVTCFEGRPTGLPRVAGHVAFPGEWALIIVDSRSPKSTPDHIRNVRAQQQGKDPELAAYIRRCDVATDVAWAAIGRRDLRALGEAMTEAHRAMRDHQRMSTPLLEGLRALAGDAGGLAMKVTGAGGGGALVGVCRAEDAPSVAEAIRDAYRADGSAAVVLETVAAPPNHS